MRVTLQSSLFQGTQQQGSLQQAITQLAGVYISGGVRGFAAPGTIIAGESPLDTLTATPLIENDVVRVTDDQLTSTNALSLTWQPYPWLPLTATGGISTIQRTDRKYIPYGVYYGGPGTIAGTDAQSIAAVDTTGYYGLGHGTSRNQTLTVGTAIPLLRQRMTLALGGNFYAASTNDFQTSTNQLAPGVSVPTNFLTCVPVADSLPNCTPSVNGQSTSGQSTYGWYAEPRLNFQSRFFVAPGFRLDGGSASGTRGGFSGSGLTGFPKMDFSWVAIDQNNPRGPLTLLRPRLSFGIAGTQPSPQAKLRLFADSATALDNSTVLPGVALSSLGNTQLQPETSRELEGGFDVELWAGRLSMTWTQYNKTRYNALLDIPVAPSVFGLNQSYQVNIGVVRNTGHELTFNLQPVQGRAVTWTVGGNISNNNNLVVRLAPSFTPNRELGIVPGYPLFGFWARPIVAFADVNHNGAIGLNEFVVGDSLQYVGIPNPKYQANLNTALTLLAGHLNVYATFAYENGLTQRNEGAINSGVVNFIGNAPGTSLATQAAILAALCGASCSAGGQFFHGTDIGFSQTVNTFRFNDLSINYVLPASIASRWLHAPSASISIQGSNLGLHTNYRGIDPDVNAFSTVSGGDETADLGQIPSPRTWWLKLSLGN
jgi:outer membrane receptor protein involved in Fe transport